MKAACDNVLESYRSMGLPSGKANISLVTPKGWKPPSGFPRGYLLQTKPDGSRISHYPAERILAWLNVNGLLKV